MIREFSQLDEHAARRPWMDECLFPLVVRCVDADDREPETLSALDCQIETRDLEGEVVESFTSFSDEAVDEVALVIAVDGCDELKDAPAGKSILVPTKFWCSAHPSVEALGSDELE